MAGAGFVRELRGRFGVAGIQLDGHQFGVRLADYLPAANQAEVQVYNISSKEGVAARTKDQLTSAGFKVTKVDNLAVPDVSATTVYYTDADDEHATADAVGKNLGAPVEPRIPALSGQPPGVIVLVAG